MPRGPSPTQLREMRNNLVEFTDLYVEYLDLTYPPSMDVDSHAAGRLRMELSRRLGDAQEAFDTVGVDLAMLPPPAFGGPIRHGLANTLFIHETSAGHTGMSGPPFFQTVLQTLHTATGYLERRERKERHRRRNPLFWMDWALTGLLGIPAYLVSRIFGVPVRRIEESQLGTALRIVGVVLEAVLLFVTGRALGWW